MNIYWYDLNWSIVFYFIVRTNGFNHEFNIKNLNINNYAKALSKDKKNIGDELRLILCKGYGNVFIYDQKLDNDFMKLLNDYFINELI